MADQEEVIKRGELRAVFWEDTTNVAGGWHDRDELAEFAANDHWKVCNIGWLVFEDDDCVVLSARRTTDDRHHGLIERIPKRAITNWYSISEAIDGD